jgi:hypothetical protein
MRRKAMCEDSIAELKESIAKLAENMPPAEIISDLIYTLIIKDCKYENRKNS